jgi:hypothetical protein
MMLRSLLIWNRFSLLVRARGEFVMSFVHNLTTNSYLIWAAQAVTKYSLKKLPLIMHEQVMSLD